MFTNIVVHGKTQPFSKFYRDTVNRENVGLNKKDKNKLCLSI